MNYIKGYWNHGLENEPVLLYFELDEDNCEIRKVEFFKDGHIQIASIDFSFDDTKLSKEPLPNNDEISKQDGFELYDINKSEFEEMHVKGVGQLIYKMPDARGIRLKLINRYDRYLYKLLLPLFHYNFIWEVHEDEVYRIVEGSLNRDLFEQKLLNNDRFYQQIINQHYLIFLKLMASKNITNISIESYDEFIKSDVEMIVLVIDSVFVDIYVKNRVLLKKIVDNIDVQDIENIDLIDSSDTRERLSVW
jgi:hypothetical protein